MSTSYTWRAEVVPSTSIPAPEIRSGDSISPPSGSALAISGAGGFALHDADGGYHVADAPGGLVRYSYTSLPAPPFQRQIDVASGNEPKMAIFPTTQRIALDWYDGVDVVGAYSDDHGETWSSSMSMFAGGTNLMPIATDQGSVIHTARVGGHIQGKEELMDGSFTPDSPWTFVDGVGAALAVDNVTYGITRTPENVVRYILSLTAGGDGAAFQSTDDCRTWSPI